MEIINFAKLLLKTAFCCMASDGHIDKREIDLINSLFEKSLLFRGFNLIDEINGLVVKINKEGQYFIQQYFDLLSKSELTEQEELILIDFAIQTIKADDQVQYAEIKFFKNIRHRLKSSDESILKIFPDIEDYLEEDIITDKFLDKISNQYFAVADLPQFDLITQVNVPPNN